MNNHLVGKTDILEPRAKIGDVVILKKSFPDHQDRQWIVTEFCPKYIYVASAIRTSGYENIQQVIITEEFILKNLTTNISYE